MWLTVTRINRDGAEDERSVSDMAEEAEWGGEPVQCQPSAVQAALIRRGD